MKFLSFLAISVPPVTFRKGRSQDVEENRAETADAPELDGIDAGQTFSQRILAQGVGHPESEIVRGFRRQIMVLLDEPVGMIVNGAPRNLLQADEQFPGVLGLPPQEFGEIKTRHEMK
jgi:hypothetical protein